MIAILLSHVPHPRMIKRINSLKKIDKIVVIYWDRTFGKSFSVNFLDDVDLIKLEATDDPRMYERLIENKKLLKETAKVLKKYVKDVSLVYISGVEVLPVLNGLLKCNNIPIVLEIADIPANTKIEKMKIVGKFLERSINRLVLSIPDYYVLTSPGYLLYYENKGMDRKRVFVFENVPEKGIFQAAKINSNLFLEKEELVVGYVGGVSYYRLYKSLKTLFEATKGMDKLKVLVAGKGPESDRVMVEAGKYDHVTLTGGYDYYREIIGIYSKIDIVYSVYNVDNFNVRLALPNKLYEAIVQGKPIIVAKGTYLESYVTELGVGYSVPYANVRALRELLETLLSNRTLLYNVSERCLSIREKYYYESVEEKFLRWLEMIRHA